MRDADIARSVMDLQKTQLMQQTYFAVQRMGMDMAGMSVNMLM
ncbi:hypothetical protein [Bacillus sp. FJAT-45350]|nr:hypothetical protein [Bacillus sp. FJAT-45350]